MGRSLAARGTAILLALALTQSLAGCGVGDAVSNDLFGSGPAEGVPGNIAGFLGGVVADEPRAALAGREVLSGGGTAADAAVAIGFALTVTLPSRAGLGGGGACLAYATSSDSINKGVPEAVLFPATAAGGGGDRPSALPMMARGLFALHSRYGKRPFETLITPAEQMARFGVPVSRAFARDLVLVAGPLAGDPGARSVFFHNGQPLTEGENLVQGDLGGTIAALRTSGVGDLYQGALARKLVDGTPIAGGNMTADALRSALPKVAQPLTLRGAGGLSLSFLPPPIDGGLAAAGAYLALQQNPASLDGANAQALGLASQWRQGALTLGSDPAASLAKPAPPASLPSLPASTTFATLDREGNAVVCAVTMNNLFGTGRLAPTTGMVMAASPAAVPPPLLSAVIAWNRNVRSFRAAVGGSGQAGAPLATAFALNQALADRSQVPRAMASPTPDPGRANVIECNRLLPSEEGSCAWATDPRGAGLAVGSN